MSKLSELRSPPIQGTTSGSKTAADNGKFRESVLKIVSDRESNIIQDINGDDLFQANYITNWTISDQHRLLAIDRLQTRTLEYHNNVHHRIETKQENNTAADDIVAQILICSASGSE